MLCHCATDEAAYHCRSAEFKQSAYEHTWDQAILWADTKRMALWRPVGVRGVTVKATESDLRVPGAVVGLDYYTGCGRVCLPCSPGSKQFWEKDCLNTWLLKQALCPAPHLVAKPCVRSSRPCCSLNAFVNFAHKVVTAIPHWPWGHYRTLQKIILPHLYFRLSSTCFQVSLNFSII